jgi:hypothetical protein
MRVVFGAYEAVLPFHDPITMAILEARRRLANEPRNDDKLLRMLLDIFANIPATRETAARRE